jgi:hypothetical protein
MSDLQQQASSPKAEGALAAQMDRRRDTRARISRPVYVQPADSGGEHFAEVEIMKDFSRNGFYFTTERGSYSTRMRLYVTPSFGCLNLEFLGEVVRVERLAIGGYGVAVRLLRVR